MGPGKQRGHSLDAHHVLDSCRLTTWDGDGPCISLLLRPTHLRSAVCMLASDSASLGHTARDAGRAGTADPGQAKVPE